MANNRNIKDVELMGSVAIPAAASNVNSNSIDLGGGSNNTSLEKVELEIVIPALANLVEEKTVIAKLQDSADDSSFTDVSGVSLTATGKTGNGYAGGSLKVRVPLGIERYIRINVATLASAGDNTASEVSFGLLF